MKIDSSKKISTDLLNENDTQQSPSYNIKRNKDYTNQEAILKSALFFAHEKFNDAKIGLKEIRENSPIKQNSRKQHQMIHFPQHNLC